MRSIPAPGSSSDQRPKIYGRKPVVPLGIGERIGSFKATTPAPKKPLKVCNLQITAHEKYILFRFMERLGAARTSEEDRLMEKLR